MSEVQILSPRFLTAECTTAGTFLSYLTEAGWLIWIKRVANSAENAYINDNTAYIREPHSQFGGRNAPIQILVNL